MQVSCIRKREEAMNGRESSKQRDREKRLGWMGKGGCFKVAKTERASCGGARGKMDGGGGVAARAKTGRREPSLRLIRSGWRVEWNKGQRKKSKTRETRGEWKRGKRKQNWI